jgi:hypothetical protein
VSKIRFCVSKKQNYYLSDSEFNFAETKIANFWQREHPVGDFSLVRFFWSSKEMNEKKNFSDYKSYYYSERGIANPARLRNFPHCTPITTVGTRHATSL